MAEDTGPGGEGQRATSDEEFARIERDIEEKQRGIEDEIEE